MSSVRTVLNEGNIASLTKGAAVADDLASRTAAIADACNRASSWGGYEYEVEQTQHGPVARVWSIDEAADEARAQRLIRNLDAGR